MDTPTVVTTPASRPLRAIGWMIVTGLTFVAVTATVKHLDGQVPAAQAAFLRYVLGLVFLLPFLKTLRQTPVDRTSQGLFAFRGLVHSFGVIFWFYAMSRITIAEVTAMGYMTPVFVTLGAALILGERLAIRRILAVVAALTGAMIVLRPGFRVLDPGHFAMLGTALSFSASYLIAKRMADTTTPEMVVAQLSIWVTLGLAPFAIAVWEPVTFEQLAWLFLVACFATAGHYTMTLGLREAPLGVTQPVTFLQLVWAVLLGAAVFGEPADIWVIAGGTVIVSAVSYIAIREAQLRAQARATRS